MASPPPAPAPPADPAAIPPTAAAFLARVSDIEWSERHRLLYMALPASNGAAGNTVVALDPLSNQIVHSRSGCSAPAEMALSDDNQFLHVACNGSASVQRLRLPELSLDHEFFLGFDSLGVPRRANDILAVPGQPLSVVVAMHLDPFVPVPSLVRVFDNGVPRPSALGAISGGSCWSLGWDPGRTRLLCAQTADTGFALQSAVLGADGLRVERTALNVFRSFYTRMVVDAVTGMVYGSDGTVFDSAGWRLQTRTEMRGPVAADPARNRVYIATTTDGAVVGLEPGSLAVRGYNPLGSSQAQRLIRWGASGLALTTSGNTTLIYGGSGTSSVDTGIARGTATQRIVPVQVRRLVRDPVRGLLYASVGPTAAQHADSVVVIDPASASVLRSEPVGGAPNALAVSADGRFLYVGVDGEGLVRRLRLPGLEADATLPLGQRPEDGVPYTAGVIRVSPTQPLTIAVGRVSLDRLPSEIGGVRVFDDTVPRPKVADTDDTGFLRLVHIDIAWNADGTGLYSLGLGSRWRALPVAADGVSAGAELGGFAYGGNGLHLDPVNRLLSVDGGDVVDAVSGRPLGTYRGETQIGGQNIALDPTGGQAFVLASSPGAVMGMEITAYDATRFVPRSIHGITNWVGSIPYDFVQLRPGWFAFATFNGVHVVQLLP